MKAIFREYGEDKNEQKYVLEDQCKAADLQPTEVRIEVRACGLSPYKASHDLLRQPSDLQFPVGQEVAGIVSEVGSEVTQCEVGDRVAAFLPLNSSNSGCATECVSSVFNLVKLPMGVSFEVAAAAVGDGVRAYTALHYQGRLTIGDTLLVIDGASSSGTLLMQLASCWSAKVLVTSSTKEEKFYLEDLPEPPERVLDLQHRNSTLRNDVMEETGGMGVDIIVDAGVRLFQNEDDIELMGEGTVYAIPTKHELISCLGMSGRWITSHQALQLDPPDSKQLFLKGASVNFLFEHIWSLSGGQYGRFQHILEDIMKKLSQGTLKPNIVKKVNLQEAVKLLPELHTQRVGKTVVVL